MKAYIKSIVALTVISGVVAILLAVTNSITAPLIEKNNQAEANAALLVVMPEGEDFQSVDLSDYELPATVTEVFSEKNGGYVVKLTTSGYGANFVIMCGVNSAGEITGATCLASSETLGYEKTYGDNLKGANLETVDGIATVAGATKTTGAYKNAIKDALNTAVIMGGGSVDIRSEDEILNDNLSAALPEGEKKFTSWFITEDIGAVDAVYSADNAAGYVFVIGEAFVGVKADGTVVGDADDESKALASDAFAKISATKLSEIDISGYELPSQIEKVYKTESGNYSILMNANGYGINGDKYTRSGEPIVIGICITSEGRVLDCVTLSQKETDGIGSACADRSFYSQFKGKTEETYKDIDAISGATITTNGYTTAVLKAFEAVKILEGEA